MLDKIEMGHRIELARKNKNMTLEEVAATIGVAASTIQRYEKGSFKKEKLPVIEAMASCLGVNPNWIMGLTDDPTPQTNIVSSVKDCRDIAADIEQMISILNCDNNVMFEGTPITDDAKESIVAAMRLGLKAAKAKNKERFTPKKYRKE